MEQDENLIPVSAQDTAQVEGGKPKASTMDTMMKSLKLGLNEQVDKTRDQMELQKKMKELQGKSDAQKVLLLKKFINEQNLKNRKMITKQLRLKKETENSLKLIEEAKLVKPAAPAKEKVEKETDLVAEFKALVSKSTAGAAKPKKLAMSGAMAKKNA